MRAGVIVVVGVLLVVALLWGLQRRLIYLPDTTPAPPAASVLPDAQDVTLETDDGLRLGAWLVPAVGTDRRMAVLVANGNAGNRAGRAPLARRLAAEGLTVLLFDYRGYGGNDGSPDEHGLGRDVRAAQRYLVERAGIPSDRVLYFGESLGAAVVTALATEVPPAGLLLRSPFVDLASVGKEHYPFLPVRTLLRDKYPLVEQLARIKVPVAVVYGSDDSVVPAAQSRTVARSAPGLIRLAEVAGADHNDRSLLDGDVLIDTVLQLADHAAAG